MKQKKAAKCQAREVKLQLKRQSLAKEKENHKRKKKRWAEMQGEKKIKKINKLKPTGNSPAAWSWFEKKTKLLVGLEGQMLVTEV